MKRKLKNAAVMKLVDIGVSNTPAGNGVRVQVPPAAPIDDARAKVLAYVVGIALGDGNLSRPNGKTTRLRISCDLKYPDVIIEIEEALRIIFPNNKVSRVPRKEDKCLDISVYSNTLDKLMPWEAGKGPKSFQKARIPGWIMTKQDYLKECIKGLVQTDGCIYVDRGYLMVNFTNNCKELAEDFHNAIVGLGYLPSVYVLNLDSIRNKYTVRIARNAKLFLDDMSITKL